MTVNLDGVAMVVFVALGLLFALMTCIFYDHAIAKCVTVCVTTSGIVRCKNASASEDGSKFRALWQSSCCAKDEDIKPLEDQKTNGEANVKTDRDMELLDEIQVDREERSPGLAAGQSDDAELGAENLGFEGDDGYYGGNSSSKKYQKRPNNDTNNASLFPFGKGFPIE